MIEAELKARLTDPDAVRGALVARAPAERAIYSDTYYDTADRALDQAGREVRLRTIKTQDVTHLLTFKEPAVDAASGSKPEYETTVATPGAVAHMLEALGYGPDIHLTKNCENYRFTQDDREFVATVVRVPEVDGTFLEVETTADVDDLGNALAAVRAVLADLGVRDDELTTELYTDAVRAARQ